MGIDTYGLRRQEAIDLLADLADELSVRSKLIKAGAAMRESATAAQRDGRIAITSKDEDMPLGIGGDPHRRAEECVGRQLQAFCPREGKLLRGSGNSQKSGCG